MQLATGLHDTARSRARWTVRQIDFLREVLGEGGGDAIPGWAQLIAKACSAPMFAVTDVFFMRTIRPMRAKKRREIHRDTFTSFCFLAR